MNTIYIDTHSNKIEFALFQNGKFKEVFQESSTQNQSGNIIPFLIEFLKKYHLTVHDIADIIVVNGPGSFTGARLGVTIAKSLAYTLNISIRVMSSILIKAISNQEKGHHWFIEKEKNGYYVGEFNDLDELLNDYFYIKNSEYELFLSSHDVIEEVELSYQLIYDYSRLLAPHNVHSVNPLYVKLIEVQR